MGADATRSAADDFAALEQRYDTLEGQVPDEWKDEIKALRAEHKKYRERWSPLEETFGGLADGDRESIAEFVKAYTGGNDSAAVTWLANNLKVFAGDNDLAEILGITATEPETDEVDDVDPKGLEQTIEERAKAIAEQIVTEKLTEFTQQSETQKREAEARARIEAELTELGYAVPKPGDPTPTKTALLLLEAKNHGGDIRKAHEVILEQLGSPPPTSDKQPDETPPDGGGQAPPMGTAPAGRKPTGDPEERMRARLDGTFGQSEHMPLS